ncbi:mitochondrial peptidyl-tRNA hydrolase [Nemania diffusa]|nr:mitochondrial peptidyl-tRNA hydrolase [Nemania diffusa]
MAVPRFLVISLGNPAPLSNSFHSAGHVALCAVQRALAPSQPQFSSERYGQKVCMASPSLPYTFIQSPTMMNISGPWVRATWKDMLQRHGLQASELGLVIVHDELEASFGAVQRRKWNTSHRGHNGLKSVKKSLDSLECSHDRWSRIAIGIGRPIDRTPDVVADYVLRDMTSRQRRTIDTEVGPKIIHCLRDLQDEWQESHDRERAAA